MSNPTPPFKFIPLAKRNEVVRSETEAKLDELTKLWTAIEGKILGMQPPRHIDCIYKVDTDVEEYDTSYHLGIQRIGGKWRLCYSTLEEVAQEDGLDWRPIVDCSTEARVDAADHIDTLMEEVVRSGKEFIPEIDKAIGSLMDALKEK